MPHVAPRVTIRVPALPGIGKPDFEYPACSRSARVRPTPLPLPLETTGPKGSPQDVAQFLTELRAMEIPERAKDDVALSWYRGLLLQAVDADFRDAAAECRDLGSNRDFKKALRVWDRAVDGSTAANPTDSWYHGDLPVKNVLHDDWGGLAAVIDSVGLAIQSDRRLGGHPGSPGRRRSPTVPHALDVDDPDWAASRGWALLIAMIRFPQYGTSMPARCTDRLTMAGSAIKGI